MPQKLKKSPAESKVRGVFNISEVINKNAK
jgi:hypothetical protein